jgi:anaerobic selenocysteine-containing dehydrogenase
MIKPNTPLNAAPLGFPANPDELAVHADGTPMRIDHAFSWEHPLSAHGLMHNVITNAVRGDPYEIDTLLIFMANMAWNSTMNTMEVRKKLNARGENGEYKIPFLVVCDAFQSETVAFADLVLPDTTYLERHDVMSMLDRPISEFDGPVDSVRVPVVEPAGRVQAVPGSADRAGVAPEVSGLHQRGRLAQVQGLPRLRGQLPGPAGRRLPDGLARQGRHPAPARRSQPEPVGDVRQEQLRVPAPHAEEQQYMRNWNRPYLDFAKDKGWRQKNDPVQLAIYSDTLQTFRLAAQGKSKGRQPPDHLRERIATYFDPLPFWYEPLENACVDTQQFPLAAITQRPMAMYHSWDSQNAWLRQIHSHNYLHVNPVTARQRALKTAAGPG